MVMTEAKNHEVRVAKSEEKLDFYLLPDSINRSETTGSRGMSRSS
jgi:hypothetical protein